MSDTLQIPQDHRETIWWRRLAAATGSQAVTALVVLSLWRELGYLARQGQLPGRLTPGDAATFLNELARDGVASGDTLLAQMREAGLLRAVPDSGDVVCQPFLETHAKLTVNALARLGGNGRGWRYRSEEAAAHAAQASLLMPAEALVDADGAALAPDVIERARGLVAMLDSALGQKPRQAGGYTATLMQNTLPVLRQFTDAQLRGICKKLYFQRTHPALHGMVTEKALLRFQELALAVGAVEGL